MMKTLFAALFSFLFLSLASSSWADLTYEVTPYSGFDVAAYTLDGGTITTDGTLGEITDANVVSWSFFFSSPGGSINLTNTNSSLNFTDGTLGMTAALDTITMVTNPLDNDQEQLQIISDDNNFRIGYLGSDLNSGGSIGLQDLTSFPQFGARLFSVNQSYLMASRAIPEPGCLSLLAVAGFYVCRRRR